MTTNNLHDHRVTKHSGSFYPSRGSLVVGIDIVSIIWDHEQLWHFLSSTIIASTSIYNE